MLKADGGQMDNNEETNRNQRQKPWCGHSDNK